MEQDGASSEPSPGLADALVDALRSDSGFRWSWWCVLVMCSIDSGVPRHQAEESAARFLYMLADYDMKTDRMLAEDRLLRYTEIQANRTWPVETLHGLALWLRESIRTEEGLIVLKQFSEELAEAVLDGTVSTEIFTQFREHYQIITAAHHVLFPPGQ